MGNNSSTEETKTKHEEEGVPIKVESVKFYRLDQVLIIHKKSDISFVVFSF